MDRIQGGPIRTQWHWLGYNFDPKTPGFVLVGAPTVLALAAVDEQMPGYAAEQLDRLEGLGGREKDLGDYRGIVSWYAELLVLQQLVLYQWPAPVSFVMEPTAGDTKFNPEVVVHLDGVGSLAVEVKAADLLDHNGRRTANPFQLNARGDYPSTVTDHATFPRDNPIKDFLIHADKKFAGFRADEKSWSVLAIVWDDYVNEPLAALTAPGSGLLTENSFHRRDGQPVTYPNIDAILLVRHQHQIVNGLANRPPADGRNNLLDYGHRDQFPFPAIVTNPSGRPIPEEFLDALHARPVQHLIGAEYQPGEMVIWTTAGDGDDGSDQSADQDGQP
jgi:hypothetical protein